MIQTHWKMPSRCIHCLKLHNTLAAVIPLLDDNSLQAFQLLVLARYLLGMPKL